MSNRSNSVRNNTNGKGRSQVPNQNTKSNKKSKRQKNKNNNSIGSMGNQVTVGAAYATRAAGKAPKISSNSYNRCRIVHRELVASIAGSDLFTIQKTLKLNPGLSTTFPWLSTIAKNWEQYTFHKLRACYFARCSTQTAGSMMICPDFDAADEAPSSELIASTFQDATEDAPWKDQVCDLRSESLRGSQARRFVRTNPFGLEANQDIKTYDVGTLYLITQDGSDSSWGKLWLEYDVEFFIPQMQSTGNYEIQLSGSINGSDTLTTSNPFGVAPVSTGIGFSVSSDSIISFTSPGTYNISLDCAGTGLSAFVFTPSGVQNPIQSSATGFNSDTSGIAWLILQVIDPSQKVKVQMTGTTVTGMSAKLSSFRSYSDIQ